MEENEYLINPIFYSSETGKPFTNCKVCDKYLLDGDTEYMVEKAFRKYKGYKAEDVVFEFAICNECHQQTYMQLSEESRNAMQRFMSEHIDFEERMHKHMQPWSNDGSDWWKQTCAVTGESVDDLEEYQLVGGFQGKAEIRGALPIMVGGKAMDELANLLSNESLDFLDGFNNQLIGPPPEFEDLLKPRRRPVLI